MATSGGGGRTRRRRARGRRRRGAGPSDGSVRDYTLRFSASSTTSIEKAYRTHWVSPELSAQRRKRLGERLNRPPDLLVIAASRPWTCGRCRAAYGAGEFLMMVEYAPACMDCAELGHLEFLPSGNPTLTRRAKQASASTAVVVRWSRARKRYERRGILADSDAIEQARATLGS
jgi:hypothetical protein